MNKEAPKGWNLVNFDSFFTVLPSKKYQVQKQDYLEKGLVPVVDQGQKLIIGYTDDESKKFNKNNVIIFGDHTRIVKYIDFDFAVGADGTQILETKDGINLKFGYYQLLNKKIPDTGYNRHFKYVKAEKYVIPPTLAEQQEIVQVLDTMSDIIRLREECISHAQDLIPALFQEMFKEINKYNIDVRQLVNMGIIEKPLDGNHGELHPKASDYVSQGIPFVMASDLINGKVDIYNCNFISEEQAKTLRKGFAKKDDVLISHKGTIGRTAIVQDIDTDYIVLTPQVTYYRILDDSRINKYFLKSYFDSTYFQNILLSKAQKGATRAYVGITEQLSLPIYLPDIKQQEQFANKVREINSYVEEQQEELENAKEMFQSLLHHAFTGELTRRAYGKN